MQQRLFQFIQYKCELIRGNRKWRYLCLYNLQGCIFLENGHNHADAYFDCLKYFGSNCRHCRGHVDFEENKHQKDSKIISRVHSSYRGVRKREASGASGGGYWKWKQQEWSIKQNRGWARRVKETFLVIDAKSNAWYLMTEYDNRFNHQCHTIEYSIQIL